MLAALVVLAMGASAGAHLAALIGVPGLGLYLLGRAAGITVEVHDRNERLHVVERDLGLVAAIGAHRLLGNAELLGDFANGFHLRLLGDFDIG